MKRNVDALTDQVFDLLVIGGGITGAGVALDAVTRGLHVALVDKGDFASGTSSVSSKLVHGGLRYLEHADFHLVYEALHERARLLRNATHLVWPLRFILPYYCGSPVPEWKWRVGLTLYDILAGSGNIRRSRYVAREKVQKEFPGVRGEGLTAAGEYFDAQMDDARVCIEVVKTAAHHGAVVANYVEAVHIERQGDALAVVRAHDTIGNREVVIRARQVVNAAGPWADAVRRLAGDDPRPFLRPTKGVHIVAPGRGLTAGFLLLHPRDGRVFFVLPWLGKTLIGTTDTDTAEGPDALTITPEDIDYLLEGHNHYFAPELTRAESLGQFAGLRPLLRSGADAPSAVSREYHLDWSSSGLLTVAGGKYTTYRSMAEAVVNEVCKWLGTPRRCRTRELRLDGAPRESWAAFLRSAIPKLCRGGISEAVALHLLRRYGRHADAVVAHVQRERALGQPIVPGEPDILAEFVYQAEEEMAIQPDDFFLRRTRLGIFGAALSAVRPMAIKA